MGLFPERTINLKKIQLAGWAILYLIHVLYLWPESSVTRAFVSPLVSIAFYLLIIYGNVLWLIPTFYERGRYKAYGIALLTFFFCLVALRMWINHTVFFKLFHEKMYDYSVRQWQYVSFSTFLILVISILFHLTIRYFSLLKKQDSMEAQRLQTELNLLKSQVQPHFLFNTLNNIYYEAYRESPRAAALIEKLSHMMRYFVEESPKETVALSTEIHFLTNYIELEKIRLRHPLQITFQTPSLTTQMVPPMLLMPLVENLFKHGIDKQKPDMQVQIALALQDKRLLFSVINPISPAEKHTAGGYGLKNLRQRLQLLYGDMFTLSASPKGSYFVAQLSIPLL